MILITGDLHGHIGINKFSHDKFPMGHDYLQKNDYVVVLGDFGFLWNNSKTEKYWIKWLSDKPWTTLFIDGNHENHDMLEKLPLVDMFDSKVGKVTDSIFHLKRGEIYIINEKKFFTFGGAASIDKVSRIVGISWWPEEIPNHAEMKHGLDNLEKYDYCVDYVLTHTCPSKIIHKFLFEIFGGKEDDPTTKFLNEVNNKITFKKWFFGHYHDNLEIDEKYIMLYDVIRGLE